MHTCFDFFIQQAIDIERERSKKWMKMINKWEQYYPGEKVRARGKGNEREGVCHS